MSIELVSIAVGALGSIVSVVTFYITKKAFASNENSEKTYLVKSKNGESREVTLSKSTSQSDISKIIAENIEYERLVEKYLNRVDSAEVIRNSKHELGYDFYLKTLSDNYFVEAKANSKPLSRHAIEKLIKHARQNESKAIVISKSGYDKSVNRWLKENNNSSQVKLFTAKNATEIRKALHKLS
ncbi:restriction endonuclease [Photobacterium sp. SP02]|uniref:restriction endonuclease n=1 Tax=Photobacterium sp. SP02 TaxID=3032280 RepID=UPI003145001E